MVANTHADPVLKRLREIVSSQLDSLDARETNPDQYTLAAWPYLQAHRNGAKQAFQFLDDLLRLG